MAPITIAIPPIIAMRTALRRRLVRDNAALNKPRPNRARTERKIDACKAVPTGHTR